MSNLINKLTSLAAGTVIGATLLFSATVLMRGSEPTVHASLPAPHPAAVQTYTSETPAPAIAIHFTAPQAGDGGLVR